MKLMCCTERRRRWNDRTVTAAGSFPVTFTASLALWWMRRLHWGWHQVKRPLQTHITLSSAAQTQMQESGVIRGQSDPSSSYLIRSFLFPTFILSLSLSHSLYASLSSPNRRFGPPKLFVIPSGAPWDARVHVLAYLHEQIQTAHYTGGTWKVNCWSASSVSLSRVCVNWSGTVTLPSSDTWAYTSGVSKCSREGMNK